MVEEWRPTHHVDYEVSNLGRVRSWASRGGDIRRGPGPRALKPRLLKPGTASHGYPTVCLGRGNTQSVHVLVAAAFLGRCPNGQEVRHKDDDRTNPRADNLEYGTRTQNILDSVKRGRWNRPRKLTDEDLENIRHQVVMMGDPQNVVARQYRVSRALIWAVVHNKRQFQFR